MEVLTPIPPKKAAPAQPRQATTCYHCGEACDQAIPEDDHFFCCKGCKFVYSLLKENGMCNYYELSNTPGIKVKGRFSSDRFAYLDNEEVVNKLLSFTDGKVSHVNLYLPQMHCASCIWLLENLHAIQPGILQSTTNFGQKEIFIAYDPAQTSLRKVVELLAFVGYEPYITFNDGEQKQPKKITRKQFYKIGIAGFAFSQIMMMSFPEYFASGQISEAYLQRIFSWLNLVLALPVFFYSASDFFVSAYKGLRQNWLNIDAPIALSIVMTFSRSVYEVVSGTGPGYFDSMSGIVFFMLVGRWFQNKTHDAFSFDRDYKSYFPLGVTRMGEDGGEEAISISNIKAGDRILVRHNEMVPADGIIRNGEGSIDYSFVSGENTPVHKRKGELVYAGARQLGGSLELEVVKAVSQSYITQLWNNNEGMGAEKNRDKSFIHPWSRYFTAALFTIAASAGIYWAIVNPANILPAVTAALIVACPCSLLLSATFTFGNMMRIFGKHKMYLKNASVIEGLSRVNHIVFDKTGTLTHTTKAQVKFIGLALGQYENSLVYSVAKQSAHPLSRLLAAYLLDANAKPLPVAGFQELAGKGAEATINGELVRIGSAAFVTGTAMEKKGTGPEVYVSIGGKLKGHFAIANSYREGVKAMVADLEKKGYQLHLLSGDNASEKSNLQQIFGTDTPMHFGQSPQSKLEYIALLQQEPQARVLMLGDGLNDAGALRQSDVGVAVSENTSQFTPASDAILDSANVGKLHQLLSFAKAGKKIVTGSFILSILYNCVGLSFATTANLSPMVAAILMPASSISIIVFTALAAAVAARRRGL
ncbi:Cu+-exporting ATPase [Cnuella takakiae]|uniref:Cu+-exporting ATPase n=1 Tax=Cnuella takakiae TaxID=1302690 RepID=A0A1M5A7R1_9BACT|nr:heavy metal translocating P-type ATPase metal-binding domain-containing protein [Cnuella takakiae]SHF26187.1 Cu+-exporting ATPase [Cnuella takakiae]